MADVVLTESRQAALRVLLAAEPIPGEPLPPTQVFDAIDELVPCDLVGAVLADNAGYVLDEINLAPGPDHHCVAVPSILDELGYTGGDGAFHIGWIHWTRHPWIAEQCSGTLGVDDLGIGFRNGPDHVAQLNFMRESVVFSDQDLALLRLLVPVFQRLLRERPTPNLPASLTISERRVLHAVAAGSSNAEIAVTFCIAESTVRKHLENSYRKLGVSNRMAAVARLRGTDRDPVDLLGRLETFA
jgi:DNA-binding CsgD family transcriptional regulator